MTILIERNDIGWGGGLEKCLKLLFLIKKLITMIGRGARKAPKKCHGKFE